MKKILASLLVLAMCAPALADVTVTVSASGQDVTVSIDASGGAVVRGLAITLDADGTLQATGASGIDAAFNAYIDAYYSNSAILPGLPDETGLPGTSADGALADTAGPGVATLPVEDVVLSLGVLDNSGAQGGFSGTADVATITYTGAGDVCISEDALRGGIVGDTLGTVTVTGCATVGSCLGDITENGVIDALDLSALVAYLTPHAPGYAVSPVPAGDEKYDLTGNDSIDALDLSALVGHLTPYAPGYSTTNCM